MRGPNLQRPVNVSFRGAPDPATKDDAPAVKVKNVGGLSELLMGAVVGAVASYFVPKLLDRYGPSQLDPQHGEPVEFDVTD